MESRKSMGRLKARPVAPIILGFVSKIRGSLKFFVHVVSRGGQWDESMGRLKARPVAPMISVFFF